MSHRSPTTRTTRFGVAGLAVAAASMLAVPVASATTPAGGNSGSKLDKARSRCEQALDRRDTRLGKDIEAVKKATGAPEGVRVTLGVQLDAARTVITDARKVVGTTDTVEGVKKVCKEAIESTRVYVLDGPKVRSVIATSRLAKVDARADKAEARFVEAIARAEKRGVPADRIADAQAKAAEVKSTLADAHHDIDGLAAELLPITPAQVNDHSAKATLESARQRIAHAKSDAEKIREDLAGIAKDLRPAKK